jgi:hypothetical protein
MNNILQLKGRFDYRRANPGGGTRNLPKGQQIEEHHINELISNLRSVLQYWQENTLIKGALVSVYYKRVIAKSNRIKGLLVTDSNDPNKSIRGAKFDYTPAGFPKHIFIHYVTLNAIEETIRRLEIASKIIQDEFNGCITQDNIEKIDLKKFSEKHPDLKATNFINVVIDAFYVDYFGIEFAKDEVKKQSIVTLYKTDATAEDIFKAAGINHINLKKIDDDTFLLKPDEIKQLQENVPYIIAMKVTDLREFVLEDFLPNETGIIQIPKPTNEPVIGVFDTPFDENTYFSEWVEYVHMIAPDIEIDADDKIHGTEVDSIIVDGPAINPTLDDGCGRFRVKHFGVAKKGPFSSFSVLKSIRKAVEQNKNIKVWNLSLGSVLEINNNFISPEAAELDKIQNEYDVIFVVAGTNGKTLKPGEKPIKIGAPADSLNSLVVNSVKLNNKPTSYHRVGPVLSFFHKPDVSYYGGDIGELLHVCAPTGENFVKGTSFSAPWIARKLAYLICKLGFTREIAKALLIDAAAGWNRQDDYSCSVGYGVVPQNIEDIVKTPDSEIRFVMTGTTDDYETYTYRLPVPIDKDKQPFFARATLCYFPKCVRSQGVDYTTTEMDIHFGRVKDTDGKPGIKSINANIQGDQGNNTLYEADARSLYRKWDNVKLISDEIKDRPRPRKIYGAGMWGLSIRTKERLKERNGKGLAFGVVVTLKEMNGKNRIEDFKKLCIMHGWLVNDIDIENQLDIYNKSEEDVTFNP